VYEHIEIDLMNTEVMSVDCITAIAVSGAAAGRAVIAASVDSATATAREDRQP
jgi:hypothetical protein